MSLRDLRKPRSFAFCVVLFFGFVLLMAVCIWLAVRGDAARRAVWAVLAVWQAGASISLARRFASGQGVKPKAVRSA